MGLGYGNMFPPSRQLVNYDYFDVANGTGYDVFYGLKGTSGANLISTTSSVYSEMPHTASGARLNGGAEANILTDEVFDITFNLPRNIKGDILAIIPVGAASVLQQSRASCAAYHYDGTTETMIASGASAVLSPSPNGAIAAIKLNQPTKLHFKKGEKLRFRIDMYAKNTAGGATRILSGFGTEPANTDDYAFDSGVTAYSGALLLPAGFPTQLSFHVPFVINV